MSRHLAGMPLDGDLQPQPSCRKGLCPNHHRLFDASLLLISRSLIVVVDEPRISYLTENKLGGGAECVTAFDGKKVLAPASWRSSAFRSDMEKALARRQAISGIVDV